MKKLLKLVLCGIMILSIIGCENNQEANQGSNESSYSNIQENDNAEKENTIEKTNNKTLNCSGDYLFTFGFMIGRIPSPDGGENISYAFDKTDGMGTGEYEFIFDDNKLNSISSIETLSSSYSKQISDAEINNPDNQIAGCEMARNSNNRVVIKCKYDENSDYIKALNTNANTKEKLKNILEERTTLNCK